MSTQGHRLGKWTMRLPMVCGMVLVAVLSSTQGDASTTISTASLPPPETTCPKDIVFLQRDIEEALKYVTSSTFRDTLVASLHVSIPEAIEQADGLSGQIAFLRQEVTRQEQERKHAETVAREELEDPSKSLTPCRRREESSYCYAMEQYYVAIAANLANQAFLEALECYQRKGVW
ncbi:MAG: hypothetical protein V3T42_08675 [Nitrospirales bacterium]